MVEITPPRIESTSDPGPGSRERPAPTHPAKAADPGKPPSLPEIGSPEQDEKHDLDEMA